MPLHRSNLAYPVLITAGNGSRGSGFYLNTETAMYLVTACHVLFERGLEPFRGITTITSLASDLTSKAIFELDCNQLLADKVLRKHDRADVAVCKVGTIANEGQGQKVTTLPGVILNLRPPDGASVMGLPVSSIRKFAEVTISNDTFLLGYPTSLGHNAQLDPATPLIRKGIIAGKTQDGRLIVDCPVYFGNSGGLVLEAFDDRQGITNYHGIGIAVEMIPFVEELWSKQFKAKTGVRYENSGYSIVEPIDRILELL